MDFETQRTELIEKAENLVKAHDFEGFEAAKKEIEDLDAKIKQEKEAMASLAALNAEAKPVALKKFSCSVTGGVAGEHINVNGCVPEEDYTDGIEYRKAFMAYVTKGTPIPEDFRAGSTTTGDIGTVIPNTIVSRIVEKMESIGKIWSRVTRTAYKGGVSVPTSSAKITATWASERATADTQKKNLSSVTFVYHKLTCKVAISFETSVVALPIFEAKIVDNIAKAMVKTIELAFVSGDGNRKPTGILKSSVPTGQRIEIAASGKLTYSTLAAAEAALPQAYDDGAVWCMTKPTLFNYIIGMVDDNKRPVLRDVVGVNGKPQYYILGREVVVLDNDYMASMADTVTSDTDVMFMYNWADYIGNTNYDVTIKEYVDEETDDRIKKALMLIDGKPVDLNSLVVVTKKTASA